MYKIFTEKRKFTKLDHETFSSKEEISVGEFLDKCPTEMLIELYQAVQSELTARYLNTIHFKEYMKVKKK